MIINDRFLYDMALTEKEFMGETASTPISRLGIKKRSPQQNQAMNHPPRYLADYADLYASDPRAAALAWFRDARFGLFIHYGLYSLLGRHEWVQLNEKIPVAEYAKLAEQFTAEKFDANFYADLAVDAGMKYINLTTRHHECFCLFETQQTDFNSVQAPNCGRDLVAELAEACDKRGLGLCLYYSHGRDWKHPHAPNNDQYGCWARPEYDPPDPTYATGGSHDLQRYVDFMSAQITELLTNYGPIASVWLDGIGVCIFPQDENGNNVENYDPRTVPGGEPFQVQALYDLIHELQPQCLVSYKQGYLHTEDYYAPERNAVPAKGKTVEVCETMMPESWGHDSQYNDQHKSADEVWALLESAAGKNANLLLNTGPIGDGSIFPADEQALRAVGERIRTQGFP